MVTRRLSPLWLLLFLAATLDAQTGFRPAWAKSKPPLAEQLQDGWIITEIGGEPVDRNATPITVLFLDTEYFIKRGADTLEAGTYALTPQGDATWIDFRIREGDNAGKVQLGVVKVEGRELFWCMGEAGTAHRPTYFANVAGGRGAAPQTVVAAVRATAARQTQDAPAQAASPPPPARLPVTLQDQLQATWSAQTINGNPPAGSTANTSIRFWGNRYTWTSGGSVRNGQFRLNGDTRPAQIDFMDDSGKLTERGIVQIEGTSLRLHFVMGSNERPADFQDPFCAQLLLSRTGQSPAPSSTSTPPVRPKTSPAPVPAGQRPVAANNPAAKASQSLEGDWLVMRWDGQAPSKPIMMRFTGNLWQLFINGEEQINTHWRIDATTDPMGFEFDDVKDSRPITRPGLIKVTGEMMLRMCIVDDPTVRLTSFPAGPADGMTMIEAIRARDTTGRLAPPASPSPPAANPAEDFASALQGAWSVNRIRNMDWHEGSQWTWRFQGRAFHTEMQPPEVPPADGEFTARPTATAGIWEVDLAFRSPAKTWIGIGKIENGTLYFCFGTEEHNVRPTAFEYRPGECWTLRLVPQ